MQNFEILTGYVENTIRTDVIKALNQRITMGLPINGAFRLSVASTSFIDNSDNVPRVAVELIVKIYDIYMTYNMIDVK